MAGTGGIGSPGNPDTTAISLVPKFALRYIEVLFISAKSEEQKSNKEIAIIIVRFNLLSPIQVGIGLLHKCHNPKILVVGVINCP